MNNKKTIWITIALVNLGIVAILGVTLRSKILFPLQGIDFTYILHAHSHFAFCGWITLALMSLMIHEILPEQLGRKRIYTWLLEAVLLNAVGMLVSFLCQGYAFFSILFSTIFVFVTYAFCFVFIRDILRAKIGKAVTILSVSALIYLALSSVGPFALAYMMASHSSNHLLYRDSVYTYLHLQYNGFFALAVFALFFNALYKKLNQGQLTRARQFATVISISIIPTLCISYLWHYHNVGISVTAFIGSVFIVVSMFLLIIFLRSLKGCFESVHPFTRIVASLSIIAFLLKSLLQTCTIYQPLGTLVYGDRAIIVGYLHLVLLGFISLYIIAHLLHNGLLNVTARFSRVAVRIFAGAVIINEAILMIQGFGNMLMINNSMYTWLLWGTSIVLFVGAGLILVARLKYSKQLADSHA